MTDAPQDDDTAGAWPVLIALTLLAAGGYFALWWTGPSYALGVPAVERPIMRVIGAYALLFLPCWAATYYAARLPNSRKLVIWIIASSVLFRVVQLPTPPFQEIDIYRYLWDGAVVSQGESPYRYTLDEIKNGVDTVRRGVPLADERLERLAKHAIANPGLDEITRVVHYSELPSPYPPVSQAVFAAPALVTPADWSAIARLNLLKTVLTGFDVATLLLVLVMLSRAGLPLGLAVAYGWCPLVMKETANSGHLDSITIFFATAALAVGVLALTSKDSRRQSWGVWGSALLLALGVGAKLYPVVLGPLFFFGCWWRSGAKSAITWALVFVVASSALLAPMMLSKPAPVAAPVAAGDGELPPAPGVPAAATPSPATDPTAGLSAFLSRWEMNDLIFMVVLENLRPNKNYPPDKKPWFSPVSDEVSTRITGAWQSLTGEQNDNAAAFMLTRAITAVVFIALALVFAWRATRPSNAPQNDAIHWLRAAFLTLAWFWLLAPTQNPWYWCWAVPLLPFVRLRAWHVLAACSLLYYTRFWLEEHAPAAGFFGTPYSGKFFFYFVVAWVEFLPWMLALSLECWWRRDASSSLPESPQNA